MQNTQILRKVNLSYGGRTILLPSNGQSGVIVIAKDRSLRLQVKSAWDVFDDPVSNLYSSEFIYFF